MMKRITSFAYGLLTVLLLFQLNGCLKSSPDQNNTDQNNSQIERVGSTTTLPKLNNLKVLKSDNDSLLNHLRKLYPIKFKHMDSVLKAERINHFIQGENRKRATERFDPYVITYTYPKELPLTDPLTIASLKYLFAWDYGNFDGTIYYDKFVTSNFSPKTFNISSTVVYGNFGGVRAYEMNIQSEWYYVGTQFTYSINFLTYGNIFEDQTNATLNITVL